VVWVLDIQKESAARNKVCASLPGECRCHPNRFFISQEDVIVTDQQKTTRRQLLKMGGAAIAMIPVIAISGKAAAATNAAIRTQMKYQDKPNEGKNCATCLQFVPGKAPTDAGGCKIMAGDTEISPNGWCMAYAVKK
jgi:hypothetical protein